MIVASVFSSSVAVANDMPPVIYAEAKDEAQTAPQAEDVLKPTLEAPSSEVTAALPSAGASRWTGGYVGANMAYTMLSDSAPAKGKGVSYGGFVGYNIEVIGRMVAGLEGAYSHMDIEFDDGSGVRGRDNFAARMRAGYAGDWFYAYGLIGGEHALATAPFAPGVKFKDTTLLLGAGVDVAVTDRVSVGVEYTRSFFKEFNYPTFPIPVDVTMQKVQSRLTYKIN